MDIRYSVHPEQGKMLTTRELRKHFLIDTVFTPATIGLTYSHFDRIIAGGACPGAKPIVLEAGKEIGADYFLQQREMGVINIGGAGKIFVDGKEYTLGSRDGLYIGRESKEVTFVSDKPDDPAKFYLVSGTAHQKHPTVQVSIKDANPIELGSNEESNKRTIYQYVHPKVMESCQLCMGMTILEPANVWNTMPTHTHDRRMEVYFYFDIPEDAVVFHLMGEPDETRHIVLRNEQAVISPSWSIHSGVGTSNYTFIWAMVGENKTFTDMDNVPMKGLK